MGWTAAPLEPTLAPSRLLVPLLPALALPRAWLCLSEMAMSPAIFEPRLNARSADLQTPARIRTDVDIIKRAEYFRWDESAFIH